MGNQEVWEEQDGSLLNGLLPNEASRVTRILEADRWSVAEARIEELIRCIQPNPRSEDCRNAVVNYVQRLITKCFSCQVFTFGSVPLKTYLPDGDIDMSAFSNNLSMKDTWANEVRDMLENEEKSENAELRVKEVQYIQAEVKIIKCLVENIVVDISFNQLGGLCTLCFLEEIDQFINQDHLFKRSIILIKAWCYYESRILGAHHGLISTYALEILVLYIFHVFNNSFTGPLEVLYRFLEFFSNFDWDNFCVSLWGPVPVSSLPDVSAEPPRKDAGELLLNKYFLDNCSSRYSVSPGSQENQGQPFISKFFNVIDPLRTNNNLGRSVSKGNFFRIRSAFAFGAKRLAGLLECPKDDVISELNMFFSNTWRRHGSGERPDAPGLHLWSVQPSERMGSVDERSKNPQNQSELRPSENHGSVLSQEHQTDAGMSSQGIYRPGSLTSGSRLQSRKTYGSQTISRASDQTERNARSSIEQPVQGPRVPKTSSRPSYASSESESAGKFQFSRTRSSPELSDASSVTSGQRQSKPETVKSYMTSSRQEISSHSSRFTASDSSDLNSSSNQSLEIAADSSRSYHNDSGFVTSSEDFGSISEALMRQQEEQDMVNMMASSTIGGINGQVQLPLNMPSALPFPLPPSMLASMGDPLKNLAGILPANIPLIGPHGGSIMQFSHGFPSSPLPRYFHGTGLAPNLDEIADPDHEGSGTRDLTLEDVNGLWPDQTESGPRGSTPDRRSFQRFRSDDRHLNSVGTDNSGNAFMRGQPKFVKDNRLASVDGQETNSTDVASSSRFMANAQASSSSRNKSFSENSKLARDKRGRKSTPSASYVASKRGQQYEESSSVHSEVDEHNDWIPLSVMGSEVGGERTMVPSSLPLSLPHGHHLTGFDPGQVFVSPSGSQSRTGDGAGVMPFAFYATGPPVPFLTMLPFCNFPSESGNFDGSVSMEDNTLDNGHLNPSDSKNFDLGENLEHLDALSSPGSAKGVSFEHLEEHKRDILNSDFLGHLQNLQYGRFCQDTHYPGPLVYPSPMVFPPMYLQGHFPWDGPGRPLSTNMNVFPVASYGPRLVPVPSTQLGQSRQQTGVFQRYGDEIPRYRGGTGTYLPNPKPSSYRDRQPTRPRNHRGNYSYERSDHADRDTSWTGSKSSRATNRNHSRTQVEKSTLRTDRPPAPDNRPNRSWDSFRNESAPAYQAQISKPGPSSLPPGAHPLAGSSNGAGPAVPSVMMLYSYEGGRADFGSSELLEFGSLRQVHLEGPRSTERGQLRGSPRSSPEQPSSPQVHRRGV